MKITDQHRKAAHLWFDHVAQALNDAGLTREQLIEILLEIRWTGTSVKEIFFRETADALFHKRSITQVTDKELCLIEQTIDEGLLRVGLNIDYPSIDTLMRADLDKQIDKLN